MTFKLINGSKISVIGVVNDAQPMLIVKNAVHPREVNTRSWIRARTTRCRGIRAGPNERTNERSIDRSVDRSVEKGIRPRTLSINRTSVISRCPRSRSRVRAKVSSKVPSTGKCTKNCSQQIG